MPLILASASATRRAMLDAAGVPYKAQPSTIDESAYKQQLGDPKAAALQLAVAKALDVSQAEPEAWVIGSDSIVSVDGRMFDKPASRNDAADHLRFFSGKTMELTSAVALARDGKVDWTHSETARLQVRPLSGNFVDSYLDQEWPQVGHCVGVFRIEGRGVNLFDNIAGDHFAILGMPLIPLLTALRQRDIIPA